VCSLVRIYHRAMLVLLQASALHGDGPHFQPCRVDLARDFKNHSVRVIKGNIISDRYHCGSSSVTLYPTWNPNDTCESSRSPCAFEPFSDLVCHFGLVCHFSCLLLVLRLFLLLDDLLELFLPFWSSSCASWGLGIEF
jgi:hypothetical protein